MVENAGVTHDGGATPMFGGDELSSDWALTDGGWSVTPGLGERLGLIVIAAGCECDHVHSRNARVQFRLTSGDYQI